MIWTTELAQDTYIVSDTQAGKTLAATLREHFTDLSWKQCRALCSQGRVSVDDEAVQDSAMRVRAGMRVQVGTQGKRRSKGKLDAEAIVHVDRDVVVVHKAAGLMTVPFEGERDTLVDITAAALRRGDGSRADLGVVQRLDKDTSGLLVFCRNLAAKRHLQQQFRARSVHRLYIALVHGHPEDTTHDTLLVRDRGDGLRGSWGVFRRDKGQPPRDARPAKTRVEVRESLRGASLVQCKLGTGRQHQIRIHLSEAGHPLLGERVYIRDHEGPLIKAPRLMLHATELGFEHPRTGEHLRFHAPAPEDFEGVRTRLQSDADEPN